MRADDDEGFWMMMRADDDVFDGMDGIYPAMTF